MDDLLQEFIAETRETLEALSGEIVAWESDPADRARLDAIFRFVHTVKGSCGFLDLPRLARLSHAAEDTLATVRSGERMPDKPLVDAVLAIVDRIGELVEAIDSGTALDDSSEDLLLAALTAEAEVKPAANAGFAVARAPTRSVRLSVDLLDRMMSGMSEMVLARNELARHVRETSDAPGLCAALERLTGTVGEMRDTVSRTRMQKIDALFSPLPRLVRDTAAGVGKDVSLTIDGGDVELDREMIEMLRDPLVHMIRNAIDHGLETAEERRAAGKREKGRLTVTACQSGNRILVEIADDGRGIDVERLVAKIIAQDPSRERALRQLGESARLDLIFEAGLSSCDTVTTLSGRGVGMDVVRTNVEQIGGRIALANQPGRGLTVSIEVPLTLAILSAVVVGVGAHRFAVPRQAIEEIVSSSNIMVRIETLGDARIASVRERVMPLVSFRDVLGIGDAGTPSMFLIVNVPRGRFALGVDAVFDSEELVIKPAAPAVMAAGVYAGQTLPDSGKPLLLLDGTGIAQAMGLRFDGAAPEEDAPVATEPEALALLLFDDLEGSLRGIPVSAVDRIDSVPAASIRRSGGRHRWIVDDRPVELVALGALPTAGNVSVLRLHAGDREVGYAIDTAHDIARVTAPIEPVGEAGPIAGVTVIDGDLIEIVDALWILGSTATPVDRRRPSLRLHDDGSGWMRSFLSPALEAAGYRVLGAAETELPDIALAMESAGAFADDASVLRLSRDAASDLYCYDRVGLLSAIGARLAERG